jgi:hypothetical protein
LPRQPNVLFHLYYQIEIRHLQILSSKISNPVAAANPRDGVTDYRNYVTLRRNCRITDSARERDVAEITGERRLLSNGIILQQATIIIGLLQFVASDTR